MLQDVHVSPSICAATKPRHRHRARHHRHLCDRWFVMTFGLQKHVEVFCGSVEFACKYCSAVVCQATKRHLQRCHCSIVEWQINSTDIRKSLQVFRDSYKYIKEMPVSLPQVEQPQVDDVVTALSDGQSTVAAVSKSRAFPVAAFASLPGTFASSNVSEMLQNCITDGQLMHPLTFYVLQTATGVTQFNPNYVVPILTAETMIASSDSLPALGENPVCLSQMAKLACSE